MKCSQRRNSKKTADEAGTTQRDAIGPTSNTPVLHGRTQLQYQVPSHASGKFSVLETGHLWTECAVMVVVGAGALIIGGISVAEIPLRRFATKKLLGKTLSGARSQMLYCRRSSPRRPRSSPSRRPRAA